MKYGKPNAAAVAPCRGSRGMEAWIQDDLSGCELGDQRLNQRLAQAVKDPALRIGKAIPLACQDGAAPKAA